jgi:two-component system cell cycle response regulator
LCLDIVQKTELALFRVMLQCDRLEKLPHLLGAALNRLPMLSGYALYMLDGESDALQCRYMRLPDQYRAMEKTMARAKVQIHGSEPIAEVFQSGKTLHIDESLRQADPSRFGANFSAWGFDYMELVPVTAHGNRLGVIVFFGLEGLPIPMNRIMTWLQVFVRQYSRLQAIDLAVFIPSLSQTNEQRQFLNFLVRINRLSSPETVYHQIGKEFMRRYPFNLFAVLLAEDTDLRMQYVMPSGEQFETIAEKLKSWAQNVRYSLTNSQGANQLAYSQRTGLHFPDVQEVLHMPMAEKDREGLLLLETARTFLMIPVLFRDESIGVFWLVSLEKTVDIQEDDLHLLEALGNFFGSTFVNSVRFRDVEDERREARSVNENLQLRVQELDENVSCDYLTGLYNFRTFEDRLDSLIQSHQLSVEQGGDESNFALLMIDIDHFKSFNDTFGHDAGNMVLEQVSQRLQELVREGDIPCRYGGEEFTVILPSSDSQIACEIAERIRTEIERMLPVNGTKPITVSIGVASYRCGDTAGSLFQRADSALYQAKNSGRNQVCCSE